jgi:hypothetical protein
MVHYYDAMPWYFRMYWHTLKIEGGVVKYIHKRMARERVRPAELEMGVLLGPKEVQQLLTLTIRILLYRSILTKYF